MVHLRTVLDCEPPVVGEPEIRWSTPAPFPVPDGVALAVPPVAEVPVWNENGLTKAVLLGLLNRLAETLDGRRPLAQLAAVLDASVYEAMLTRVRTSAGRRHRVTELH
nr:Rv3235 family protein [Actinomycetota bacterium]